MSDQIRPAGLVGPHRESHEPRLMASMFVATAPAPFTEWDGTAGITDWGMDENDQFGDCGAAATDHNNIAKVQDYGQYGQLGMPKFAGTLGTYGAYGKAMGETALVPSPVGPIPDQGVDNASWLGFLYKEGIIYGYGEVPLDQLDAFTSIGRGLLVGVAFDGPTAINDFQAGSPWDAMTNRSDGHDILLIKTHTDGSGSIVTWGGVQDFTAAFRQMNFTDAWIIFDADDPQVNHTALQSALQEVHGVVVSTPVETASSGFWGKLEKYVEEEFAKLSAA